MSQISNYILHISSDAVMFWLLQALLIVVFVAAFVTNKIFAYRTGRSGISASVERGHPSMAMFYGTYAALNGLLVALCLSVGVIEKYRVFWALFDTSIAAYVCIFNSWSRNALLGLSEQLRKIETR